MNLNRAEVSQEIEKEISTSEKTNNLWSRLHLSLFSIGIFAVIFFQKFGEIVFLSRMDRIFDPVRMTARSFEAWNPYWDLGALQLQMIGYLIPFDAFFLLTKTLGIPFWISERIFIAGLLAIAFWGFIRLAEELEIGEKTTRLLGGFAYIGGVFILSDVGNSSVGVMGAIFLPWILVPLVRGAKGGSERRAAAKSGVAIALMGGANAAIAFAVLPAGLIFLLSRSRGTRRKSLLLWWIASVFAAIAYWFFPLIINYLYSQDIGITTENVLTTARTVDIFNVLRGTSDWVSHMQFSGGLSPAGNTLIFSWVPIIAISVITGLGIAGLTFRNLNEKRFVLGLLLFGVFAVGSAYGLRAIGNPFFEPFQAILDGPLSAFRNMHKFGPIVALATMLGFVHFLQQTFALAKSKLFLANLVKPAVTLAAVVFLLAGAFPLWNNTFLMRSGVKEIPNEWNDARSWISENIDGHVLLLPDMPFGEYTWGFIQQNPLQFDSDITWAIRSQGPLSGLPFFKWYEAVDRALYKGGGEHLVRYLRDSGVGAVVIQADTDWVRFNSLNPTLIKAALEKSGLTLTKSFGTQTYGDGDVHQIEVYEIPNSSLVQSKPTAGATWINGDPIAISQLPDSLYQDRSFLVVGNEFEQPIDPPNWIVTDAPKYEGYDYGTIRNNKTYVFSETQDFKTTSVRSKRRLNFLKPSDMTTLEYSNVKKLEVSSVGPGPILFDRREYQPLYMFDKNPATLWRPAFTTLDKDLIKAKTEWINIEFNGPRNVRDALIGLAIPYEFQGTSNRIEAKITTDSSTQIVNLDTVVTPQPLPIDDEITSQIRIELSTSRLLQEKGPIGITELYFPEIPIIPFYRLPSTLNDQFASATGPSPQWVINRDPDPNTPSFEQGSLNYYLATVGSRAQATTLDSSGISPRQITVPHNAILPLQTFALSPSKSDLVRFVNSTPRLNISANSTYKEDLRYAARNAIDGDLQTSWKSQFRVRDEFSSARFLIQSTGDRVITSIRVIVPDGAAQPNAIRIGDGDAAIEIPLDSGGYAVIPAQPATKFQFEVRYGLDESNLEKPIEISEIQLPELNEVLPSPIDYEAKISESCLTGPRVKIGNEEFTYEITTSISELATKSSIPLTACQPQVFTATAGKVEVSGRNGLLPVSLDQIVIGNQFSDQTPLNNGRKVVIESWNPSNRKISISAGESNIVTTGEIFNAGWIAKIDGEKIQAVEINGWEQGFVVPAGDGGVIELTFGPQRTYIASIFVGLILLIAMVVMMFIPSRKQNHEKLEAGEWSWWIVAVIALGAGIFVVGPVTLLLPIMVLVVRRYPTLSTFFTAALLITAGLLAALQQKFDLFADPDMLKLSLASVAYITVIAAFIRPTLNALPHLKLRKNKWRYRK